MIRKYILPTLAVIGVVVGIYAAVQSARVTPPAPMASDAPTSPYATFVAGAGLVEANTENVSVGAEVPGVVSKVYVKIGSDVKRGDPLFTIDDRATRATLAVQEATAKVAESQLAHAKYELELGTKLTKQSVISEEDYELRRYAADTASAQLALAEEQCKSTGTTLELLTVRAPADGQVMQLKIRVGEYAPAGVLDQPLILFGNVSPLCVRVDVDENEAWRVVEGAPATGFLRGNKEIRVPLEFVRFEPYVIPKVSLTGEPTERVDTRVMQVIYSFDRGNFPIKAGQQMDIFIDASACKEKARLADAIR